jgi:hypothetical protein
LHSDVTWSEINAPLFGTINSARFARTMLGVFVGAVGLVAQSTKKAPTPPGQPIPYSHKQHLLLGLKCKEYHKEPDPGEVMPFPATDKCMSCQTVVARDKPNIKKAIRICRVEKTYTLGARLLGWPAAWIFCHDPR